jgi:geranylgeranyl diphosphate synthase type II
MGIGFQLTDDLLDVFADQAKFGKQIGGDIISNKKTYLLIRALEDASEAQKKNMQSWLEQKEFDKAVKVEAVTQIYKELGIEEKTRSLISSYFDKAFNLASHLQVNSETSLVLRNYMEQLIGRDH